MCKTRNSPRKSTGRDFLSASTGDSRLRCGPNGGKRGETLAWSRKRLFALLFDSGTRPEVAGISWIDKNAALWARTSFSILDGHVAKVKKNVTLYDRIFSYYFVIKEFYNSMKEHFLSRFLSYVNCKWNSTSYKLDFLSHLHFFYLSFNTHV